MINSSIGKFLNNLYLFRETILEHTSIVKKFTTNSHTYAYITHDKLDHQHPNLFYLRTRVNKNESIKILCDSETTCEFSLYDFEPKVYS